LLLNEIDIEKNVSLFLEESPTIWLLDIPGSCVEKDGPFAPETILRNELYKQVNFDYKLSDTFRCLQLRKYKEKVT
jgi:hypothetical protein